MTHDAAVLLSRSELTFGMQMKRRSPGKVYLAGLATLGVYWIYWYYKISRELRDFDDRVNVWPGRAAWAFGLLPLVIPNMLTFYRTGRRIEHAQRTAGLPQSCDPLTGLLLWITGGIGVFYYQGELNKIIDRYGAPTETEIFHYA